MKTFARRLILAGLTGSLFLLLSGPLFAQAPKISYISPLGGKAGSTVELSITGQDMDEAEELYFSFPGVKVEQKGSEKTKITVMPKKGPPPKGLITQKFMVTLPPDAPLGIQDVRVAGKQGVSNPRAFLVSDVPQVVEQEPNDDINKAQKIELNSGVSGVISVGTDVDYYVFSGKKGQRVVVSCLTTSIDSKLPALLQLYSAASPNYLASNKAYQNNDALVDAVLPADGDYYVRVCSFTYTLGGPDYFYHLSVSTAPWIDAVYPPTVEPGKQTKVTIYGRNLPGGVPDPQSLHDGRVLDKLVTTVKAPVEPQKFPGYLAPSSIGVDGFPFRLKNDAGTSNTVLIGLARAPVVVETGDHDTAAKAQKVTIPCEIAGMIEKRGEQDWYVFQATKGQVLSIDALGDRLGSQIDLFFKLYSDKDVLITDQDENLDITANQFYTRTDDPARYKFVVPADGEYKLMVSSKFAFVQFGPRSTYVVRIMPDSPDFALVAMPNSVLGPDSITLHQGSNQAYTVFVLRQGLPADITLRGENLPPGVSVLPQVIAGNQKVANLIVSAAPGAAPFVGGIKVVGTTVADGKKIERGVSGATITWPVAQAAPTITRLDRELVLAVRDKAPYTLTCEKTKISVPQGEKITVEVKATRSPDFKQPINVVAVNLPGAMIQTTQLTLTPGKDSGTITLDGKAAAVPVGHFTLTVRGQTQPVLVKQQPKGPEPLNLIEVCNPISLTVIPKSLGKVSVVPAALKVPVGKEAEMVVKIARSNDFMGPFEVTIVDAKGFTAKKATIPAGQDEVKVHVTADAAVGTNAMATIRATAMFDETPVIHETKVTLTVTK